MAISQIPALTAHISFLLWELNIWQTMCWQIYPPLNGNFTDSCSDSSYFIPTLRTHIWQTRCWQIYHPDEWQFHRFLLWQLIFHSYSGISTFDTPSVGRSTPHQNSNFRDPYAESSYLSDQVFYMKDLLPARVTFYLLIVSSSGKSLLIHTIKAFPTMEMLCYFQQIFLLLFQGRHE